MQADGRFVEHVEHAGGAVAHGTGQLHALAFAGRQGRSGAIEREVAESELQQPTGHIEEGFADVRRHRAHVGPERSGHATHPVHRRVQGHRARLGEIQSAHPWGARRLAEPRAAAIRAGFLLEEPCHAFQPLLVLGIGERILEGVQGVEIREVDFGEVVACLRLVQDVLLDGRAIEDDVAFFGGEVLERHVGAHAHRAGDLFHQVPHQRTPWQHRALVDAFRFVGYERRAVHLAHDAGAGAGRACAGRVEGQGFSAGRVKFLAAIRADDGQAGGHVESRFVVCTAMRAHM